MRSDASQLTFEGGDAPFTHVFLFNWWDGIATGYALASGRSVVFDMIDYDSESEERWFLIVDSPRGIYDNLVGYLGLPPKNPVEGKTLIPSMDFPGLEGAMRWLDSAFGSPDLVYLVRCRYTEALTVQAYASLNASQLQALRQMKRERKDVNVLLEELKET